MCRALSWSWLLPVVLLAGVSCFAAAAAQEAKEPPEVLKLEDILGPAQLAQIAQKRTQVGLPPGSSYRFTFKDVPNYGTVDVYFLVNEKDEGKGKVRRLAEYPSAAAYCVRLTKDSDVRKHLTENEFADVLEQVSAIEKAGGAVQWVEIRRGLFDVGKGSPEEFLKRHGDYWDGTTGQPAFDKWPAQMRASVGRLTASVVHTSIGRGSGKSEEIKTIEARQFFGNEFPVLDESLTKEQKGKVAEDLGRSNVRDGVATVELDGVKDLGSVALDYVMKDGKPLPHPTAMVSHVRLTGKEIGDNPVIVRKYLAPEGAEYLMKQIADGEKAGQKLKAVEITQVHLDVVTKGEAGADAAYAEFKKDIKKYCRRDVLIRPEAWPERFRRPDGRFDLELSSAGIVWLVTKAE